MNKLYYYVCSALLAGGVALTAVSCADNDLDNNGNADTHGALVRFSVNDVQEAAISRGVMTRGVITPGLGRQDLAGGKLAAQSNRNIDVCLIETTVEGVNPVKVDTHTRAKIIREASLGDFSTSGIRGTAGSGILNTPEWFHAKKTKPNGELYSPIYWAFSQPKARFFAVHPDADSYSKMTINNTDATGGSPSVDFEVDEDVKKQVDLMTACTGDVEYSTQNLQPKTSLDFRHALTGIRFAVGQNLSWNKTIDKVELRGAVMKSKYVLSKQFDGTGATWDHTNDVRGTATLSGVSVSTSASPNATIMGKTNDNYTFYMIPQVLTGYVTAYVHCTDGTEITVPLKGEWKAGTTRTYKLSQTGSTWTYVLTPTDPSRPANFDETQSQPYGITSYRYSPGSPSKQQDVPWKVIGYDANNDGTFTMEEKPAWLVNLSKMEGNGSTAAEQGTATLIENVTDLLAKRNNELKNATALGSTSAPYDLSLHNYKGNVTNRNTANSYLISAPGFYRIPLVYGNAIKNGSTNESAYKTTKTGTNVLSNFQDHTGQNITDPWIEKTNSGANNGVDGAEMVWADAANLVHLSSTPIKHDGGEAFLEFEVKANDIQSGNAVIAVKKGNTIVWSWHLWFAPKEALGTIEVTNHQKVKCNFTKETLGWKPTQWRASTHDKVRVVKVKVVQTIANNGITQEAVINIAQEPGGNVKKGVSTLYQFGRKDAFPGVSTDDLTADSKFTENAGFHPLIKDGIQNPGKFYTLIPTVHPETPPYANIWSADNTGYNNVAVVKTVYDPCPAGFKMPALNSFTGFTKNGSCGFGNDRNVNGTSDLQQYENNQGYNFWTNGSKNATIYFPGSGCRSNAYGYLMLEGFGNYWEAVPRNTAGGGSALYFDFNMVCPTQANYPTLGCSVRPVSE